MHVTVGNDGMYLNSSSLPTLAHNRYAAAAAMFDKQLTTGRSLT